MSFDLREYTDAPWREALSAIFDTLLALLATANTNLRELHVDISQTRVCGVVLAAMLEKCNRITAKACNLSCEELREALRRAAPQLPQLRSLVLRHNHDLYNRDSYTFCVAESQEAWIEVASALLTRTPGLEVLDVSYCVVKESEARQLLDGVTRGLTERARLGHPALKRLVVTGLESVVGPDLFLSLLGAVGSLAEHCDFSGPRRQF
jgi:hypothetical protein